ncbi:MAG: hypothetical protein DDT33_01672 [Firmicutes bacterium]|nr:hypothetical protein [Bacillota bacterium]
MLALRISPCTSYPLESKNSVRYDPSCPVMPVIKAILLIIQPPNILLNLSLCKDGITHRKLILLGKSS